MNVSKYICLQGQVHHQNRPKVKILLENPIEGVTIARYHVSKGLKAFGKDRIAALDKELCELQMRDVVLPLDPDKMTQQFKKDALQYLAFLTKKRCSRIKARGCDDGRKQQKHTHCDNTSSPSVSTIALLLNCTIDTKEKRGVTMLDVLNAFMQADMDDLVDMKIEGSMAEFLVKIDPKMHCKHLRTEKGKLVLYVRLQNALYGTMKAALFFGRMLPIPSKNGVLRSIPTIGMW
eukprot:10211923-Ditylum_brightwellii.AAC.1